MLINISNHSSSEWDVHQKLAALQLFDDIIDISFPEIPAEADENEIDALSDKYLNIIRTLKEKHNNITVHLMGEMTFSFALLKKLQQHGIPVVASTTERIIEKVGDTIIKKFNFVRFRYYI